MENGGDCFIIKAFHEVVFKNFKYLLMHARENKGIDFKYTGNLGENDLLFCIYVLYMNVCE